MAVARQEVGAVACALTEVQRSTCMACPKRRHRPLPASAAPAEPLTGGAESKENLALLLLPDRASHCPCSKSAALCCWRRRRANQAAPTSATAAAEGEGGQEPWAWHECTANRAARLCLDGCTAACCTSSAVGRCALGIGARQCIGAMCTHVRLPPHRPPRRPQWLLCLCRHWSLPPLAQGRGAAPSQA